MCYGSGCRWEKSFSGECGLPQGAVCPVDLEDYDDDLSEYADRLHDEVQCGDRSASSARIAFNIASKKKRGN